MKPCENFWTIPLNPDLKQQARVFSASRSTVFITRHCFAIARQKCRKNIENRLLLVPPVPSPVESNKVGTFDGNAAHRSQLCTQGSALDDTNTGYSLNQWMCHGSGFNLHKCTVWSRHHAHTPVPVSFLCCEVFGTSGAQAPLNVYQW